MEDAWNLAKEMTVDVLVSNVYHQFFHENSILFKDKVILDVGCRTGLLSLLAIEAGAIKVFAVGNMESAMLVSKALGESDKAEIFEALKGSISQIKLPCGLKKVDVIVSEWMGHALYADSLFREVLEARDKWLVKGGHIIPSIAHLYICGVSHVPQQNHRLPPLLIKEDYVHLQSIMTEKFILQRIDIRTAKYTEVHEVEFQVKALKKGRITGCVLYFDIGCVNAQGLMQKFFDTGPDAPRTYMKQTFLSLHKDALNVAGQELLVGLFIMTLNQRTPRGVHYSMGMRIHK